MFFNNILPHISEMGNKRHSSVYGQYLTNIRSHLPRSTEEPNLHIRSIAPRAPLSSFIDLAHPSYNVSDADNRPMEIDQVTEVEKSVSRTLEEPDGKERADSMKHLHQESKKHTKCNKGPSSNGKSGEHSEALADNIGQETPTTSVIEDEPSKPRESSTTTLLCPSNLSSPEDDVDMVDSFKDDISEVQGLNEAEGCSKPPVFSISDHCSDSSLEVQEVHGKEKKPEKKVQHTLKKTVDRALTLTNRRRPGDRVPAPESFHDLPQDTADKSCRNDRLVSDQLGDGNAVFRPQDIPRLRHLRQDAQTDVHRARFNSATCRKGSDHRFVQKESKQSFIPKDPILAASLDAMALEHANFGKPSTAVPSISSKVTGKRQRDTDHLIRRQDHYSTSTGELSGLPSSSKLYDIDGVLGPKDSVAGMPDRPKHSIREAREVSMPALTNSKGKLIEDSTGNQPAIALVPDKKCQNDLDFLASVVLSQEFLGNKDDTESANPKLDNGPTTGWNKGETINQDSDTVQTQALQQLSVDRLSGSDVDTAHRNTAIISDRLTSRNSNEIGQHPAQLSSAHDSGTSMRTIAATVEDRALVGHNHQARQSDRNEEEPKSEVSYIDDECSTACPRQNPYQNASRNATIQVGEEGDPRAKKDITPAKQVDSDGFRFSDIALVYQTSSSPFLNKLGKANKLLENNQRVIQLPKTISVSQKKPSLTTQAIGVGGSIQKKHTTLKKSDRRSTCDEDDITSVPSFPQKHQSSQQGASSSTHVKSPKAPKHSFCCELHKALDEITPAAPRSQNSQPSQGTNLSHQGGSSTDGKRVVSSTTDEDVSEITPAPPRPQRSRAHHVGASSQRQAESNGAGSSAQGAIQEETERVNSGRAQPITTTLPYTFRCDICGAMFNRRFNLNKHIRNVHHNIRKFKCSMCEERFLQKSHRAAHLLAVHHKLRPFVCHLCAKSFSWLGVLRKHLQAIHKVPIQTKKRAKRTRTTQVRVTAPPPDKTPKPQNAPLPSEKTPLWTPLPYIKRPFK